MQRIETAPNTFCSVELVLTDESLKQAAITSGTQRVHALMKALRSELPMLKKLGADTNALWTDILSGPLTVGPYEASVSPQDEELESISMAGQPEGSKE